MAEKIYVDESGLTLYDQLIKAYVEQKDAANLKAAKDYSDGLAGNYEPSGSIATAKGELNTAIGNVETKANAAKDAADAAQESANSANAAAQTADGKAVAADNRVAALETKVGSIPDSSDATSIVDYIDKKTTGIATSSAMSQLESKVNKVSDSIDILNGEATEDGSVKKAAADAVATVIDGAPESFDTLKEIAAWIQADPNHSADLITKTNEIQGTIGSVPEGSTVIGEIGKATASVTTEKERAEGAESGLDTRLTAVESKLGDGDGSVASQISAAKTELEGKINTAKEAVQGNVDTLAEEVHGTDGNGGLKKDIGDNTKGIEDIKTSLKEGGATANAIAEAKKAGIDAQADVDDLEVIVKGADGNGGLKKTVEDNSTAITSNSDKITALEDKVGDGFKAIEAATIRALFNAS